MTPPANYGDVLKDNPGMTPNQAIFIYHLRQNPHGVVQIKNSLENGEGMCALGLGMEAFDIIRTEKQFEEKYGNSKKFERFSIVHYGSSPDKVYDPYHEIAKVLEIPWDHVNDIYVLNDDKGLSFGQIADIFEQYVNSDRKLSPKELWRAKAQPELAEQKATFIAKWDKARKDVKALNEKEKALEAELVYIEEDRDKIIELMSSSMGDPYWFDEDELNFTSGEEVWSEYMEDDE